MTLLLLQSGPGKAGVAGPGNTVLPVISGTAKVGQTLTTTNGTWTGSPTGYTYQWQRGGSNIGGATANSYLLVSTDLAATITVIVTATSTAGSASATSAGVGPVAAPDLASYDGVANNCTLSIGNLTATHSTTTTNDGVRSLALKSSGKYYFEVTIAPGGSADEVGILLSTGTYTNLVTNATNCTAVRATGGVNSNGGGTGKSVGSWQFLTNPVISWAIDLDARLAWCRVNGGNWNGDGTANPTTGVGGVTIGTGSYSPAVGLTNAIGSTATGNFGQSTFAYAAPSGFGNWTA